MSNKKIIIDFSFYLSFLYLLLINAKNTKSINIKDNYIENVNIEYIFSKKKYLC